MGEKKDWRVQMRRNATPRRTLTGIYIFNLMSLKEKFPDFRFVKGYEDVMEVDKDTRIKLIFNGVNCISRGAGPVFMVNTFELMKLQNLILYTIETLTPREFLRIFPLEKTYDGEKYECKDYFFSMEVINEYGIDRRIESAVEFLFDYSNMITRKFLVHTTSVLDELMKEIGEKGFMDYFLEDLEDTEDIGGLFKQVYTNENGTEYFIDDGKPIKLRKVTKVKNTHLRRIK